MNTTNQPGFVAPRANQTAGTGTPVDRLGENERDRVWVDREGWRFEWSPDKGCSSGGWWQVFRPGGSLADETTVPPDDGPFWPVGLVDAR